MEVILNSCEFSYGQAVVLMGAAPVVALKMAMARPCSAGGIAKPGRPWCDVESSHLRPSDSDVESRPIMKLVAGTVLLLAAEQAYAHAHLVQFPNHDVAARVLVPASLVLAILGSLLLVWGLVTESRCCQSDKSERA